MSDRITDKAEYGVHITLYCKNHPSKRWSTKNISHIGARTIFYNLYNDPSMGPECDCTLADLVVLDPQGE